MNYGTPQKKGMIRVGSGKYRLINRRGMIFFLVGISLLCSGCALQNVLGKTGHSGSGTSQVVPYQLSAEQSALVSEIGYPDSFILLFYEEEAVDGSLQTLRLETWNYYSEGESHTFLNGELDSIDGLVGEVPGSLAPLPYVPEQFAAHMSRDDVLEATGVEEFIEVPLEDQYLEGSDLYYADALSFGLVDGTLRYLEALALVEE